MAEKSSAVPEKWPMELVRGDRWPPWSFQINDEAGVKRSLVGAVILMDIKSSETDSTYVKRISSAEGGFTIAGDIVTFSTNVDPLQVGKYNYDISVLLSGALKPTTIFKDKIVVVQDVTDSNV
jgi:hypothetical protein